ncbi:hypothetical protein FB2170_00475 [Maribacter sp. HTCC2170]|nr:hypothetical protein FB2170_00475 [Maribacter sp. HTCC2170]
MSKVILTLNDIMEGDPNHLVKTMLKLYLIDSFSNVFEDGIHNSIRPKVKAVLC